MRSTALTGVWAALVVGSALMVGTAAIWATPNQLAVMLPGIASVAAYVAFALLLYQRLNRGVFGELGFLFVSVVFAYTVMPAITFLLADLETSSGWVWEKLTLLLPDQRVLGEHLWRHVLFQACASAAYLAFRGRDSAPPPQVLPRLPHERTVIALALCLILLGAAVLSAWSAPVVAYVDHYTRFDHLGWVQLRIVYVFLLLKSSAYFVLMTVLFRSYARHRTLAILVVLGIGAYELSYSMGQRIDTLGILLGAACLYHYTVRPITLKFSLVGIAFVIALFSVVEVVRMLDFGGFSAPELNPEKDLVPASELGTVFFTGFHLYAERQAGQMPPASPIMLFNDLLAVLPFVDHEEWNPMYWYARHYFPESIVPPSTVGPIADSAIWGGELDLMVRAGIIGAMYAGVMRWFLPRRHQWWALVIFAYLFATCVVVLKHSVFYQLVPLVRTIAPGLLVFWLLMRLLDAIRPIPAPAAVVPPPSSPSK